MDAKNLAIAGLSLSALMLACTLITVESHREAQAAVSILSSRETAVITAAACSTGGGLSGPEAVVMLDRTTHVLRVYQIQAAGRITEVPGSPLNLIKSFETAPQTGSRAGTPPAKKGLGGIGAGGVPYP